MNGDLAFGAALLKMLVALAVVCALAYLAMRFGLRRLVPRGRQGGRLAVVDHCALGPGKSVWLLRAGRRYLLLGGAERSLTVLGELDGEDVDGDGALGGLRGAPVRTLSGLGAQKGRGTDGASSESAP